MSAINYALIVIILSETNNFKNWNCSPTP